MADYLLLVEGTTDRHTLEDGTGFILLVEQAITGTFAGALGSLTATISGTVIPPDPGCHAPLGSLTATMSGGVLRSGTMVANFGSLTGTASSFLYAAWRVRLQASSWAANLKR